MAKQRWYNCNSKACWPTKDNMKGCSQRKEHEEEGHTVLYFEGRLSQGQHQATNINPCFSCARTRSGVPPVKCSKPQLCLQTAFHSNVHALFEAIPPFIVVWPMRVAIEPRAGSIGTQILSILPELLNVRASVRIPITSASSWGTTYAETRHYPVSLSYSHYPT